MHCPNCAVPFAAGDEFCGACGTRVPTSELPEPPPPTSGLPPDGRLVVALDDEPSGPETPAPDRPALSPATGPDPAPRPGPGEDPRSAPPIRSPRRRFVLAAAAVVVLGTGGFLAFRGFGGRAGGAGSPEGAVRMLATAANHEDPAAALDAMAPEEVRALAETFRTTEGRARKLGFSGRNGTFDGVDLSVDGLRLRSEELGDGVAMVVVEAGRVTWNVEPGSFGTATYAALVGGGNHPR